MDNKGRVETPLKDFTLVFNSFIKTNKLNPSEKLVFLAIKCHLNNVTMTAFPSVKTICNHTGLSKPTVLKALSTLEEKQVLKREQRQSKEKGKMSNLYTLYDSSEVWESESNEEIAKVISKIEEKRAIETLNATGKYSIKEKESASPTKVNTDPNTSNSNDIMQVKKNQEVYPMEIIKRLFDYETMIHDNPYDKAMIDTIIEIVYDILNSKSDYLKINKEEKPRSIVASKILKLTMFDIMYVIRRYSGIDREIKNPKSYITSMLYSAHEQQVMENINKLNI